MKRIFRLILSVLLIFSLFINVKVSKAQEGLAAIDPQLQKLLNNTQDLFQVIVTFKGDGPPTESQKDLLTQLGISKGVTLKSLPMAGVTVSSDQVQKLSQSSLVQSIYLNKKLTYFNADATTLTGVDKVRADDDMRKSNGGLPVTGKGIGVVINDSGVDGTHKDLEFNSHLVQNVLGSTNLNSLSSLLPITYTENVPNTDNNSGHGTHVAGTVGGTGAMSGGKYEGVAPGANLIGYGSGAALFVLDGIGGFDYALTHQAQYGVRVITNSWGSSGDFDPNDPINIASKKAYDRGIVVLFAAGNEGPGENTHNPYAKAPWVISVAAGDKNGKLADFSSRGTKGVGGTFNLDGVTWTWEDRPTITAPGVDIVSTRAIGPVSSLAAQQDIDTIEPAYLPYYTVMSGTSMATPHVAGIVALMLEANPKLSPTEVKQYLQDTATNMPGYEPWEVGAGYVNAYAAVDKAFTGKAYGSTVNLNQTFNANVNSYTSRSNFTVDYNPLTFVSTNQYSFQVESGITTLTSKIDAKGLLEETGNPLNLVLIAPDGTEYSSGVSTLFPLYTDRVVSVTSPIAGTWKAEIRGIRGNTANPVGIGLPETVNGTIALTKVSGFTGLNDINTNPASASIQNAVLERLVDSYSNGSFQPNAYIKRSELARYLVMGGEIRQSLSTKNEYSDVTSTDLPFVSAVTANGAAFRGKDFTQKGVIVPKADGTFKPTEGITRAELAYSLVQTLGLEKEATSFTGDVTVQYNDQRIKIDDANQIPTELKGYVQIALDLNILNAKFSLTQGAYDLQPTVHATFSPSQKVTRGDYAVAVTRYFNAFLQ